MACNAMLLGIYTYIHISCEMRNISKAVHRWALKTVQRTPVNLNGTLKTEPVNTQAEFTKTAHICKMGIYEMAFMKQLILK